MKLSLVLLVLFVSACATPTRHMTNMVFLSACGKMEGVVVVMSDGSIQPIELTDQTADGILAMSKTLTQAQRTRIELSVPGCSEE